MVVDSSSSWVGFPRYVPYCVCACLSRRLERASHTSAAALHRALSPYCSSSSNWCGSTARRQHRWTINRAGLAPLVRLWHWIHNGQLILAGRRQLRSHATTRRRRRSRSFVSAPLQLVHRVVHDIKWTPLSFTHSFHNRIKYEPIFTIHSQATAGEINLININCYEAKTRREILLTSCSSLILKITFMRKINPWKKC